MPLGQLSHTESHYKFGSELHSAVPRDGELYLYFPYCMETITMEGGGRRVQAGRGKRQEGGGKTEEEYGQ